MKKRYKLYRGTAYGIYPDARIQVDAYIGRYSTPEICQKMVHFLVNDHNMSIIMEEPTKQQVLKNTIFEYEKPAWVEPKCDIQKGKIVYSVAYKYSYKHDPITHEIRYEDNVTVVNYGDTFDTKCVFFWEEEV